MIEIQWLASIWRQNDKNVELRRKTFKTTQNYKTNQITMNCIDWTSKRSKQRKTTKVIKLQWLASIGCQNDQNNGKLQNRSNYNDLHRLMVKTIKTKLNYKSDRNPMTCIDLTSKRSKMLSYVAKHSKQRKTTKPMNQITLHRLDVKTIKTTQNYKSNQITMTCMH